MLVPHDGLDSRNKLKHDSNSKGQSENQINVCLAMLLDGIMYFENLLALLTYSCRYTATIHGAILSHTKH